MSTKLPKLNPPVPNNTLIVAINMGRENTLAQRLVCSLRTRGEWPGYVMLLTDTKENYDQWNEDFHYHCGPVIVKQVSTKDLIPLNASGLPIQYRKNLPFKRFKTMVWEYAATDWRLDHIEYILYLDVDIVVGDPLEPFFKHTYVRLARAVGLLPDKPSKVPNPKIDLANHPDISFFTAFQQRSERAGQYHTGIMFLHKDYSKGCLECWRD